MPLFNMKCLSMCVVGSGPSGFYVADAFRRMFQKVQEAHEKQQHAMQRLKQLRIDMLERLPAPHGLVRYGVAPDHDDMKNVTKKLDTMANEFVNWHGNVHVGKDVSVQELSSIYDIVVIATGADTPRRLNVDGAHSVLYAKDIVNWYNGHPCCKTRDAIQRKIQNAKDIVIIGHGNVSLDICRILCRDRETLRRTDIDSDAMNALESVRVQNIKIVGRRGVADSRFTIKELREVVNIQNVSASMKPFEYNIGNVLPQKRRTMQLFTDISKGVYEKPSAHTNVKFLFAQRPNAIQEGSIDLTFMKSSESTESHEFAPFGGNVQWEETAAKESLKADLVVASTGFIPHQVAGIPYSADGNIRHANGKVENFANIYASGWAKEGSKGDITWAIRDAQVIAAQILREQVANIYDSNEPGKEKSNPREMNPPLRKLLDEKKVQYIDFSSWRKIALAEEQRGSLESRKASKIPTIEEMLQLAKG